MKIKVVLISFVLVGLGYAQQPPKYESPVQPAQTTLPNQQQQSSGDVRPIPDPTILTMQALERSLSSLKEVVFTRLNAIDEATRILATRADRVPSDVDVAVNHLKELHVEKFGSIATQFLERDTRTEQLAAAGQLAIKDALQAAKEAVQKSEGNTIKLLDLLAQQIDDLKGRVGAVENQRLGQINERSTQQNDSGLMISVISGIVGMIGCVVAIGALFLSSRRTTPTRR